MGTEKLNCSKSYLRGKIKIHTFSVIPESGCNPYIFLNIGVFNFSPIVIIPVTVLLDSNGSFTNGFSIPLNKNKKNTLWRGLVVS